MAAFLEGMLAGYGIAVPVGAIAILIVEKSLREGFWPGFMAGAGAATGDLIYATLAVVAGAAVALALSPYAAALRLVSALVLVSLGLYGLWRSRGIDSKIGDELLVDEAPETELNTGYSRTYAQFLGLTMLNPLTVTYFAALILGRDAATTTTNEDRLLFVLGAALASLSWQTLLAIIGALAKHYLTPRFRLYTVVAGNLVIIGLGIRILISRYGQS